MHDVLIRNGTVTMHNISDLKAYYNRQLLDIGSIVKEVVGVNS